MIYKPNRVIYMCDACSKLFKTDAGLKQYHIMGRIYNTRDTFEIGEIEVDLCDDCARKYFNLVEDAIGRFKVNPDQSKVIDMRDQFYDKPLREWVKTVTVKEQPKENKKK